MYIKKSDIVILRKAHSLDTNAAYLDALIIMGARHNYLKEFFTLVFSVTVAMGLHIHGYIISCTK